MKIIGMSEDSRWVGCSWGSGVIKFLRGPSHPCRYSSRACQISQSSNPMYSVLY